MRPPLKRHSAHLDYGQAVKFYEAEPVGLGRYKPAEGGRHGRSVIAAARIAITEIRSNVEMAQMQFDDRFATAGGTETARRPAQASSFPLVGDIAAARHCRMLQFALRKFLLTCKRHDHYR